MNLIDMLRALHRQGIGLLEAIHGMSKEDLIAVGMSRSQAGLHVNLAETFFGKTKFTRQQRKCVEAALAGEHSVEALAVIDKSTRALLDGDEWALRLELCGLRGTVDEIRHAATQIVRDRNRALDDADARAYGRRAVKGGKNTDARGCRTMTITGPERDIAVLKGTWEKTARALRKKNPKLSYEQAMYDAAMSGSGRATEKLTPHIVIALPDWAKLLRHEGDESIFALTDGTTITGAALVAQLAEAHHLAGLYDPVSGPVNLYRSSRRSNAKQRALLDAESILCERPGCTTPAVECHDHHITAWEHGGETNLGRMTKLCAKHNGDNDDDPHKPPKHGRVDRGPDGRIYHHIGDGPPTSNTHPIKSLAAMALAARQ